MVTPTGGETPRPSEGLPKIAKPRQNTGKQSEVTLKIQTQASKVTPAVSAIQKHDFNHINLPEKLIQSCEKKDQKTLHEIIKWAKANYVRDSRKPADQSADLLKDVLRSQNLNAINNFLSDPEGKKVFEEAFQASETIRHPLISAVQSGHKVVMEAVYNKFHDISKDSEEGVFNMKMILREVYNNGIETGQKDAVQLALDHGVQVDDRALKKASNHPDILNLLTAAKKQQAASKGKK